MTWMRTYQPHRPRDMKLPAVLCPWCKAKELEVTADRLYRMLRQGHVCCSSECAGKLASWERNRRRDRPAVVYVPPAKLRKVA